MKKILLIEPNMASQQVIKQKLEQAKFLVHVENNARNGIRATLNNQYDLIIMDFETPDSYGMDISEHINSPIMIMKDEKHTPSRAEENKNFVYLSKPLNVLDNLPLILKTIGTEKKARPKSGKTKRKNHKKESLQIAIGCLISDLGLSQQESYEHIIKIASDKKVCKYLIAENILKKYEKK
ncbi:response regulator [Pseudoalteromonas marina]|uniref:Response regulatory domain-containing protein n=1 Tax=Pseudoalteromonas marina TaxID=267375 RepID=A0ABT9FC72_9GAMM|nr:response regulator [Pseudoalteromonas marina]MDP2564387.1 hypothetical protein [Pseudoalteromonas marina]